MCSERRVREYHPTYTTMQDVADSSLYNYIPVLSAAIIFLSLFMVSSVAFIAQVIIYRQWWLAVLPIGTLAEVGGYITRIYAHDDYRSRIRDPYVAMMCLLIITPCLFAAIHFATLGRIMTLFPARYSLVKPILVTPFFVTIDIASLVIQGVGAGMSGSADTSDVRSCSPGRINWITCRCCWCGCPASRVPCV